MAHRILSIGVMALVAHGSALAQLTNGSPAPLAMETPRPENLVTFDNARVELRRVGTSWQVWAGTQALKDFGDSYTDAAAAVQLIRELKLNQYGVIGSPRPVLEYWLSEGRAPLPGPGRYLIRPFDPQQLHVRAIGLNGTEENGVWCLCDDQQLIFNFAGSQEEAQQALVVCQKYGFNRVAYVGQPDPKMIYLLHDPISLPPTRRPEMSRTQQTLEEYAQATQNALLVPEVGYVGERKSLNPRQLEVRQEQGEWCLVHDTDIIARFGVTRRSADDAYYFLRDSRATELCRLSVGDLMFFTSYGQIRAGIPLGVNSQRFDPARLEVKEVNGTWALCERGAPILLLGTDPGEAQLALSVIQHYQFDHLCRIGHPLRGGLRFLARSR